MHLRIGMKVDLWRAKHKEASTWHSRLFFGSRCQYPRHSRNFPTNKENRETTDLYISRWMQSKPKCKAILGTRASEIIKLAPFCLHLSVEGESPMNDPQLLMESSFTAAKEFEEDQRGDVSSSSSAQCDHSPCPPTLNS
ncbi:uncharacterized protein [Zea mays]|uniref:uncharacterized protein n=1 Tax=Zea mays TaxID=4577 RepID=UPI0009A9E55C|nr:uncharacterized protein LOC103634229 [Zea mays]|eukprot:XP_020397273.1 uncharacterized protein LOC103634229 [Zea mays]